MTLLKTNLDQLLPYYKIFLWLVSTVPYFIYFFLPSFTTPSLEKEALLSPQKLNLILGFTLLFGLLSKKISLRFLFFSEAVDPKTFLFARSIVYLSFFSLLILMIPFWDQIRLQQNDFLSLMYFLLAIWLYLERILEIFALELTKKRELLVFYLLVFISWFATQTPYFPSLSRVATITPMAFLYLFELKKLIRQPNSKHS